MLMFNFELLHVNSEYSVWYAAAAAVMFIISICQLLSACCQWSARSSTA